ncbi:D-alanyl-D-alanine carboxypeptidase/D-alanyl-D-alanine-endopeptidase [Nakamurella endophytica]|uniref:D-alanyl-D-alanine carboxypeptidase/D-alanyl-D-alanine-endopeptidase n=1 Tax=Nakamurella endophytica TaxID=1748367 RepID=A0A917SPG1_9ACTN|nr:D-alanyl-D-alanine carboxypeptidase/D-alanyl-D-alanine-endopeptidase [Nakamurella endophytica]
MTSGAAAGASGTTAATTAATTPTSASASTGASSTGAASTAGTPTSGAGTTGSSIPGLDPAALAVMNKAPYTAGQWAISVRDLDSGRPFVSYNADKLFQPGSVVKTYSVGAAWQQFGPDHTVVTPVKRTGRIVGNTLQGDLVLVGAGDLTMGGRTKPDGTVDFTDLDHNDANAIPGATLTPEDPLTGLDQLAAQVRSAGIRHVSGDVVVDDRLWEPHALENGPVTPIVINNNLIDFTTTPGRVGAVATVAMRPKVAPWTVTSQVKTVPAGQPTGITVTAPREGTVVLTGTIAADSAPVVNTYAFKDPATFARTAFIEALQRKGVSVAAKAVADNPGGRLPAKAAVAALPAVAKLTSLSLDQEATYTLKISYNLGAETFICLLAVQAGSTKCEAGLARAAEIWRRAGLDPTGAVLIDGSGLPGNLITADNQVQLETIMAKRPDAARWKATLPVLGVDGSLALVQSKGPAKGKVFAKTGTLGAGDLFNDRLLLPAKALGGYIDTKAGRHLAFAVISTNSVYTDIQGVFAANDDVGKVVEIIQQSY